MVGRDLGGGWILPNASDFVWGDFDRLLSDASPEWKRGVRNQFMMWVREWFDDHPWELEPGYQKTLEEQTEWTDFRTRRIRAYLNKPDEPWQPILADSEVRIYVTAALITGMFRRTRSIVAKSRQRQQQNTASPRSSPVRAAVRSPFGAVRIQQPRAAKRQQNAVAPTSPFASSVGSTASSPACLSRRFGQRETASLARSSSRCTFDVTVVRVDGTLDQTLHGVFQSSSGSLETLMTDIHDRPSLFVKTEEKVSLYGVKSTEGGWVWLDCQSNLDEACQRNFRDNPKSPVRLFAFLAGPPSQAIGWRVRTGLNMAYPVVEPGRPGTRFPVMP